jgi:outer membrane protein TolC
VGQRATTTTNLFANFSPQVQSSLALNYTQPLLRGFHIDATRQQLLVNEKNREIADVQLRQSVTSTTRAVRNAYWELAYANRLAAGATAVARPGQRSAAQHTRARRNRHHSSDRHRRSGGRSGAASGSGHSGQSQIETAQDTLRSLIFNTNDPNFWNVRIEPTEMPQVTMVTVDTDALMRNALDKRTDLEQTKKTIEASDISIRFARNQTLPDVTASIDYGLTGLGGTRLIRDSTESSAAR